ncbi:membrane protein insertase YidC [Goekera deserti]|uniref:Membrane protein insertase YidC n=1 Tax=Goekera deserti TaxID=2497753 RepID=A0A7K3WIJ8_9ACTN|nr:membrane protein insertase YidC [Goekera deserti]NDI47028.1 membrane protein insertase YidC [Goekera deserti]NEL56264.1 membrane protein insertase YidC [Goekera deserti]
MLDVLYTAVAWLLEHWHALVSTVLDPAGGPAWALAIVLLVVTVRLALVPLYVRQVRSQRALQALQPELAALRERHGDDRAALATAMSALQAERGVNPLAGCLPMLLQLPVLLALLHVLRRLTPTADGLYGWTDQLTAQAARADLFGAPISASFAMGGDREAAVLQTADAGPGAVRVVALVLIAVMCLATFLTQRSLQRRTPAEGTAATVQRVLLVGAPLGLFVTGFFFPIGVLLYWATSNVWTLVQQEVVHRLLPPPTLVGSP